MRSPTITIETDPTGFRLVNAEGVTVNGCVWAQVLRVKALKRDFFAVDLVCLDFTTESGSISADEEMAGWESLIAALPIALGRVKPAADWLSEVQQTAFSSNETLVYDRASRE